MQHAATRSTRQRRPLFTPLPARAVSWPPLDTACAPSPAYKRPPFFPKKIHTIPSTSQTTSSLLSITPSSSPEPAELPERLAFPATRTLPRPTAGPGQLRKTSSTAVTPRCRQVLLPLHCTPSPPSSLPAAVSSVSRRRMASCVPVRLGLTSGAHCQFFFFCSLPQQHTA
jgi:hypothetical protein